MIWYAATAAVVVTVVTLGVSLWADALDKVDWTQPPEEM